MIPTDDPQTYARALEALKDFGSAAHVRGRFVQLYLGLRRGQALIPPLGSASAAPATTIEGHLDDLYLKTHRAEPFVVLTDLFGQSTAAAAPFSTRTGATAPGHKYPTNTWRNNLGIQKGIGCPASPDVIARLLQDPTVRLSCPHMSVDDEGRQTCGIEGTVYRGEEHSIWLRRTPDGYQVVDLNDPATYRDYLKPAAAIPVFALIAALYSFGAPTAYPTRTHVGLPEFATDFALSIEQVESMFDADPESPINAQILGIAAGRPLGAMSEGGFAPVAPSQRPGATVPLAAVAVQANSGVAAEIAVAEDLKGRGWSVTYFGGQRALGYDLEAARENVTILVEVKSSVGVCVPELRESEWLAAQANGDNYILALVDFVGSPQQRLLYIRNPAAHVVPAQLFETTYRLPRPELQPLGTSADFL